MAEASNPRYQDNPSTYFVTHQHEVAEMVRLLLQDRLLTESMGGPLAEQRDSASLHRILDVGCGPGGWLLEVARLYPHMALTGIDISWKMIEYARTQKPGLHHSGTVEFRVMDATKPLAFPDAKFDLVNVRLASSFLLANQWPRFLVELRRVLRAGGIVRVTDGDVIGRSGSLALTCLADMLLCAAYNAGHLFAKEVSGVSHFLPHLLADAGYQQVQSIVYPLLFQAGTVGGEQFYQNIRYVFQTALPFIRQWGCASEDYDSVYQQALIDIQQPDFSARGELSTVFGMKHSPM